jgi:hypothetical protein
MSFMGLGYCWNMGFLRADIAEINDDGWSWEREWT